MPGTNDVADYCGASVTKKKVVKTLSPGVAVVVAAAVAAAAVVAAVAVAAGVAVL